MRILVPLVALLFAALAFVVFAINTANNQDAPSDVQAPKTQVAAEADAPAADPGDDKPAEGEVAEPADSSDVADAVDQVAQAGSDALEQAGDALDEATQAAVDVVSPAPARLRILTVAEMNERGQGKWVGTHEETTVVLGSLGESADDKNNPYLQQLTLSRAGASIDQLAMSGYDDSVEEDAKRYEVLNHLDTSRGVYRHFAAQSLTIDGQTVTMPAGAGQVGLDGVLWAHGPVKTDDNGQSVTFILGVVDADGKPLVDIRRTYHLSKNSYDIDLNQTLVNRSDRSLSVVFGQNLQADIEPDAVSYMGDRRRVVTGLFSPSQNPGQTRVYVEGDNFSFRDKAISRLKKGKPALNFGEAEGDEVAWVASENRYFAVAAHAAVPASVTQTSELASLSDVFATIEPKLLVDGEQEMLALSAKTDTFELPAGGQKVLNLGIFVGPRTVEEFSQRPYDMLRFEQMIRYELGCAVCTFQWLAKGLLGFLKFIHGFVGDWGVAIIVLVLCVRLILHPLTKKSQVNMMIFGKQMQKIQPELEKLKKKYGDDPAKMQQEQMRLWRENGVNPLRMLGCLPMFLQMPIWVALYAMIYFAIELWQQPAFYGLPTTISQMWGGYFLADLAVPDRLIVFRDTPLHPFGFGQVDLSSLNVLPIIWACINLVNMKLTQPPAASEQAAQQQKIMRVMMVLFAGFLYSAPSALTLYMCASTGIGILDAMMVRRHVKKLEDAGTLLPEAKTVGAAIGSGDASKAKKEPKPGSWRAKLAARMEMAQKMMEQQQKMREQQLKEQGRADNTMGGNRAQRRAQGRGGKGKK